MVGRQQKHEVTGHMTSGSREEWVLVLDSVSLFISPLIQSEPQPRGRWHYIQGGSSLLS